MIDSEKVKSFWKTRSDKYNKLPFESIANLEEKSHLLEMKIKLEQECIMPLLSLTPQTEVLDLGAGVGQWTFRFSPLVKKVVAVEYMDSLVTIGRLEAQKNNYNNVEFITSPAEEFKSNQSFDLVFISGLFVYLDEKQAQQLIKNLYSLLKPGGRLLLRDGTSILENTHYINNRYSDILNEHYSAIYRTREQYISLFKQINFNLIKDGQVFPEGCPLNKFSETRLWYYQFEMEQN
jgi:SAM-dependent methyltransferase